MFLICPLPCNQSIRVISLIDINELTSMRYFTEYSGACNVDGEFRYSIVSAGIAEKRHFAHSSWK
jgi:hypothetical protein